MLEVKNAVFPSPQQWEAVVKGMRNAYKSYDRYDSKLVEIAKEEDERSSYWVNGQCLNWNEPLTEEDRAEIEKIYDEGECSLASVGDQEEYILGKNDKTTMKNLCLAQGGEPSHSKFLRQLPVIVDINAPLYFWKQLDQYKIGTTTNSESTMHTIMNEELHPFDFSATHLEHIEELWDDNFLGLFISRTIDDLNLFRTIYLRLKDINSRYKKHQCTREDFKELRELIGKFYHVTPAFDSMSYDEIRDLIEKSIKDAWYAVIELLPESYMQKRTLSCNYAVLRTIVRQRIGHDLTEWFLFIKWIWENVPMSRCLIFDDWEGKYKNFYVWGMAHLSGEKQREFARMAWNN